MTHKHKHITPSTKLGLPRNCLKCGARFQRIGKKQTLCKICYDKTIKERNHRIRTVWLEKKISNKNETAFLHFLIELLKESKKRLCLEYQPTHNFFRAHDELNEAISQRLKILEAEKTCHVKG